MFRRKRKIRDKAPLDPVMLENFEGSHNNSELFRIFRDHKGRLATKWIHYFEIYEEHLKEFRGKPVNILEIGVHKGGSLQTWKEYFGRDANIFGLDIFPECKKFEEDNIRIFIGDQSDRRFLKDLTTKLPKMDIIIDDGGHMSKQQIVSFEELYPHMSDNGVYIVEDTHTNYWRKYQRGSRMSFVRYAQKLTDKLNAWHFDQDASLRRFCIPHAKREGRIDTPEFTKTTRSVTFYDSMVVFKKAKLAEPYYCYFGSTKK